MTGFGSRREVAEYCARRADEVPEHREVWRKKAEWIASDIRLFAGLRKKHGAPYPAWALDYRP